jgi:PhnB protein
VKEDSEQRSQTAKPKPIPDRYRRVTPALVVEGAGKALEFCAAGFGATERLRFSGPDGAIAHAEIEIDDAVGIVEDASPYMGTQAPPPAGLDGTPAFLYIYV